MKKQYLHPEIRIQEIEIHALLASSFQPDQEITGPVGRSKWDNEIFPENQPTSIW